MADDKQKDIFKRAAEIASVVPEPMQDAAFLRAFDMLIERDGVSEKAERKPTRKPEGRPERKRGQVTDDPAVALMDGITRAEHPEIAKAGKVLDRSLMVLRIAQDSLGIDGLTAVQIAKVLTDQFRLRTTRQRVSQVLDDARDLVDRVAGPKGSGARYRLMAPGERYLEKGPSDDTETKRRPRRAPAKTRAASAKQSSRQTARKAGGRRSARKGPRAALEDLVTNGYFSEPRTIGHVRDHLESKKGLTYKVTDLSPTLTRMLRGDVLDRDKNESGQYEYYAK